MGIWVRSQDRKQLVNANDFYISKRAKGYCISTGRGIDIGSYSSEEKAIKVLNDIQKTISNQLSGQVSYFDSVYQMPND